MQQCIVARPAGNAPQICNIEITAANKASLRGKIVD
jgi:hypothetical protein